MPWTAADAKRHTKTAGSGKAARQWSHVANDALKRGMSEGAAVRMANGVAKRAAQKKRRKSYRGSLLDR